MIDEKDQMAFKEMLRVFYSKGWRDSLICHGHDPDTIPDSVEIMTKDKFAIYGFEEFYDMACGIADKSRAAIQ